MRYYNNLGKMRQARNYSLHDVSRLTGLNRASLIDYEIGKNPITMKALGLFVIIFKCLPSEFFSYGSSVTAPKELSSDRYKNMNRRVVQTLKTMKALRKLTIAEMAVLGGLGIRTVNKIMQYRMNLNMRHVMCFQRVFDFPLEEILD